MTAIKRLIHGDFTGLAANYAKFRPGYSQDVLSAIIGIAGKAAAQMDVADVGAGTGIWTQMLAERAFKSVAAVEPNDDMRSQGEVEKSTHAITWIKGSAEATGLKEASADLLCMASSFHWPDFDKATAEFHRVLKPAGLFVALWNPRHIAPSPLLVAIENKIYEIAPQVSRVSSGSSAFVEKLTSRFEQHPFFHPPLYLEAFHTMRLSREHYIGVWESVNDIRSQMGEAAWAKFMDYVREITTAHAQIDCIYRTRAWVMRRKD